MQSIYIDPRDYKKAEQLANAMYASVGNDPNNPTGVHVEGRYKLGLLGEFAFATWLRNYSIYFEWEPVANGKSDNGDFILSVKGKPVTIDVKTCATRSGKMRVPMMQYAKTPEQWRYVALQQSGERYFNIWGIAVKGELTKETKKFGDCMSIDLGIMRSPNFILTYCDKS